MWSPEPSPGCIDVGFDEVGRGPLAGPVIAAAVYWGQSEPLVDVRDSKQLSPVQRARLAEAIWAQARGVALGSASPAEIDRLNILRASLLAMRRAFEQLRLDLEQRGYRGQGTRDRETALDPVSTCPESPQWRWWIDGTYRIVTEPSDGRVEQQVCIRGDAHVYCIAAASIVAKVHRDRLMGELHLEYPQYGFDRHKGYPTSAHLHALEAHGPCPIHRQSYAPVRVFGGRVPGVSTNE